MPNCYIIYSETLSRFYVGACQNELEQRIMKHNQHNYGKHRYTAKASDWKLFLSIEVHDYSHAIRIERKIKAQKSSSYKRNLMKYPELVEKLKIETQST